MGKKRLSSVLGIDIGSQSIKVAEVQVKGGEATITALGMASTPEGAVDHTGVYDSDSVGLVLKELLASSGTTVPQAVVSIAGQASVLVRTLEVPKMNPAELKEHMQWEITRNIPFAESTVVSDFRAFEPDDPAATTLDVVMAIAPQSAVDTVISLVKKAGKQMAAIDVEPLGLARSLKVSYDKELIGQTVCVVDVGHKKTSINIYKDAKLLLPRQVPIGGELFTKTISEALNITVDEAERLKVEKAEIPASASTAGGITPYSAGGETQAFSPYNPFANDPVAFNPALASPLIEGTAEEATAPPQPPAADVAPAVVDDPEVVRLYNAMASIVEEFVAEVRRSIDYYRSKGGNVDSLVLCGGGSKIKGLSTFLTNALGIHCEMYDPLKGIPIQAKRLEPGLVEHHRQDFAVAVGNGLHIVFE